LGYPVQSERSVSLTLYCLGHESIHYAIYIIALTILASPSFPALLNYCDGRFIGLALLGLDEEVAVGAPEQSFQHKAVSTLWTFALRLPKETRRAEEWVISLPKFASH
jgi:hypothetical protein